MRLTATRAAEALPARACDWGDSASGRDQRGMQLPPASLQAGLPYPRRPYAAHSRFQRCTMRHLDGTRALELGSRSRERHLRVGRTQVQRCASHRHYSAAHTYRSSRHVARRPDSRTALASAVSRGGLSESPICARHGPIRAHALR